MPNSDHAATDRNGVAIAAIVFAVLALSFGDALIKLTSVSLPIWQLYVLRSVLAVPLVVGLMAWSMRDQRWMPTAMGWAVVRSLLLALMWVAYYVALPHIPLAVAAAAYYTLPLFIALFARIFIGDAIGLPGWFAIGLGFAGIIVMLRPDADGINVFGLLPIFAAILYALAMILTRTRCRNEQPLVLSLMLNLTFIAVGTVMTLALKVADFPDATVAAYPFLLSGWSALSGSVWGVLAMLAVIIVVGSTASAYAYQNGRSSVIATFDYGYLAFATLWGLLIFAEVPDGLTIMGMAMIAAAGIIAARR